MAPPPFTQLSVCSNGCMVPPYRDHFRVDILDALVRLLTFTLVILLIQVLFNNIILISVITSLNSFPVKLCPL